jgi:hypothetical protein
VHVVGPADHPQDRDGLVGADHQLDTRPLRRRELLTARWEAEPAGAERRLVGLGCDLSGQAEIVATATLAVASVGRHTRALCQLRMKAK